MDMDPLKAGIRAEPGKPFRQGVGVHGATGIVGEDQIFRITPPAPQLSGLLLLPLSELPEQVQGQRGDPERAAAALVLRGVEVGPVFRGVVQRPADGDGLAVKVHTIPADPQQLPPAQARQEIKGDGGPVLYRGAPEGLQQLPGVLLVQIGGLFRLLLWQLGIFGGIMGKVAPFYRLGEHGGQAAVVRQNAVSGQLPAGTGVHAVLLEVGIKLVDVAGLQVTKGDMAQGVQDTGKALAVAVGGLPLQLLLHIVRHPASGEVVQPNSPILDHAVFDLLFKLHRLALDLLLGPLLRHAGGGLPGHGGAALLPVQAVAAGNPYQKRELPPLGGSLDDLGHGGLLSFCGNVNPLRRLLGRAFSMGSVRLTP